MTLYCDVDGTLLDSSARHEALLRDLFREDGLTWPAAAPDYLTYKADGHSTRAWLLDAGLTEAQAADLAARWQAKIETPPYLAMDRAYPDAVPFLQAARGQGDAVVLISARQDADALRQTLARCGLLPLVEELLVVPPLHAADEKAARLRGKIAPGDKMVGDTEADLNAARQLGLPCYLLDRGFRSRRYWQRQGIESYGSLSAVWAAMTHQNKED